MGLPKVHPAKETESLLALEKMFKAFLPYMGIWWPSWSHDKDKLNKFSWRLHMKFGFDWPIGFRGEDVLKK